MKTVKNTFAIKGQEPQAKNIFAFEAMSSTQKENFNHQYGVYVCRNSEGMYFSKDLLEAFQFNNEDEASDVIAKLENSQNMSGSNWETILLADGQIATEDQIESYARIV